MVLGTLLYTLLTTGASLLATSAAGEFAKGAGKAAFEALKARLVDGHGAKSVALVADAGANPAYAEIIKADLGKPEIAGDAEVRTLARQLEAAIEALPAAEAAPYAVAIREIRAGRDLLFEDVEGVKRRPRHLAGRHDLPQGQGAAGKTLGGGPNPADSPSPLIGRARAGRDIIIEQAPVIDVGLVLAIAEGQGYLAPEKAAALAEQVLRTQADLEQIRRVDPDWRAEVDAAIDAFNRSDLPGAHAAFARIDALIAARRARLRDEEAGLRLEEARSKHAQATLLYAHQASAAEPLLAQAAELAGDNVDYWLECGRMRVADRQPPARARRPSRRRSPSGGAARSATPPPRSTRSATSGVTRATSPRPAAPTRRPSPSGGRARSGFPLTARRAATSPGRSGRSPTSMSSRAGWPTPGRPPRKASRWRGRWPARTPSDEPARDLAAALSNAAALRREQGDLSGARDALAEALRIRRMLAMRDPADRFRARRIATSLSELAYVLEIQGDLTAAQEAYEESVAIHRALAGRAPGDTEVARDLSVGLVNAASLSRRRGGLPAAAAALGEALAIRRGLVAGDRGNAVWAHDLASLHIELGMLRRDEGDLARARSAYEESLRIMQGLRATDPNNAVWAREAAWCLTSICATCRSRATSKARGRRPRAASRSGASSRRAIRAARSPPRRSPGPWRRRPCLRAPGRPGGCSRRLPRGAGDRPQAPRA